MGRSEYGQRLLEAAGGQVAPERLMVDARREAERLEGLLEAVAARMDPDVGWQEQFETLRRDHPADAAGVLELYRREIARAEDFVRERGWVPMPTVGVEVVEIRNPVFRRFFALAMYLDGKMAVTVEPAPADPLGDPHGADELGPVSVEGSQGPSTAADSPDLHLREHCAVCVPPLAVHEVYPGHHVAFSRAGDSQPDAAERLAANRRNVVYHEGWGLYSELLMLESGYYRDSEPRLLGALRLLYLRLLRAWIDPALHLGQLSTSEARELYVEAARLTPSAAEAEVERHMRDPVLKASYFLGLCQILELRSDALAEGLDLETFHGRFLGEPFPVPRVAKERLGIDLGPFPSEEGEACSLPLESIDPSLDLGPVPSEPGFPRAASRQSSGGRS
ncbi:MAG: DUF885 domain-containing protein [Holophagales bacterium]|nr:DUF885 domain-containing protein [Holophagales bacterium]